MHEDFDPPGVEQQYEAAYSIFEYHLDNLGALVSSSEAAAACWMVEVTLVNDFDWVQEIVEEACADAIEDAGYSTVTMT